jgi:hypothetical protein
MTVNALRALLATYYVASLLISLTQPSLSYVGAILATLFKSVPVLFGFFIWQAILLKKEGQMKTESNEKQRQEKFVESVQNRCGHQPVVAVVIGGSGFELQKDEVVLTSCIADNLTLSNIKSGKEFAIPFSKILNIEITGPGTVSTSAGLIGGGFGVQGALKGILVASTINALTRKTTTDTFLRISTSSGEVHLHTSMMEPKELRLVLSPAIVAMEATKHSASLASKSAGSTSDELKNLHQMHLDGALTHEEFALAKERVLSGKA